jgi:protein SCO1/2
MRTLGFFLLLAAALPAQEMVPWVKRTPPRPDILSKVGFEQRLNAQAPLDLPFRDEHGRQVRLGEYFGKKPVVLQLVYYKCPMLCTLALNGLLRTFRALPFTAGKEFTAVVVSINPEETPALAAAKKASYLEKYRRPGAEEGWHFLTGPQSSISALAEAVGFRYAYDPKSQQYAHTTGFLVLTPDGRIARYQYGVEYSAADLRLSLVEASNGKIGTPVDQVLLYCFHYDPAEGKYSAAIMNVLRLASAGVLMALVAFIALMIRRDRRREAHA